MGRKSDTCRLGWCFDDAGLSYVLAQPMPVVAKVYAKLSCDHMSIGVWSSDIVLVFHAAGNVELYFALDDANRIVIRLIYGGITN